MACGHGVARAGAARGGGGRGAGAAQARVRALEGRVLPAAGAGEGKPLQESRGRAAKAVYGGSRDYDDDFGGPFSASNAGRQEHRSLCGQ